MIYGKWSVQASKQANIHTHVCNEVTLVWGSLRLAPIICFPLIQLNREKSNYFAILNRMERCMIFLFYVVADFAKVVVIVSFSL